MRKLATDSIRKIQLKDKKTKVITYNTGDQVYTYNENKTNKLYINTTIGPFKTKEALNNHVVITERFNTYG